MESKPDSFKAADGNKLFFQSWSPEGKPEMVIAMIHGLGEHSGRYQHWAKKFCEESFAFAAFDLRGHGKSEGKRGKIPSIEVALNDIGLFLAKVNVIFPGIPAILYGHSLGGNLAVNYILSRENKLDALVLASPWLKLSFPVPKYKQLLSDLVGPLMPSLILPNGLDPQYLSRDQEVIVKYQSDPLVHDRTSAGFYLSGSRAGEKAISRAVDIKIPVLIMHGTADGLTSHEASKSCSENSGDNVTLKLWDGFYHELHNEPEKDEVFSYITGWLLKNVN
jgi:alpha-beta hydrolase superfamily lysophospholipase